MYKYIGLLWKNPKANLGDLWQQRLMQYRRQPATLRIPRPTRLDKARMLGYKPKKGIFIVRQKLKRGGHSRPRPVKGRKPSRLSIKLPLRKNYQQIAEERVSRKFPNCEVLNSYLVGQDGPNCWYEVILIDRAQPTIKNDTKLFNLAQKRGRAQRGLTSAGRKSRGLRRKGKGVEKARPSRRANKRRQ